MKTILVYTGVSAAFQKQSQSTLYTTENACHVTIHAGTTIDMYRLDALLFRWRTRLRAWGGRMGLPK